MSEATFNLLELEKRIQKLISLHKALKESHEALAEENRKLTAALDEEREKSKAMEEGIRLMKESEKGVAGENIGQLKKKINDIISEIDKSVQLINEQK
jgi:uncharacterized coiled-coil DUF342 family protein